jgi:hypothetical protein
MNDKRPNQHFESEQLWPVEEDLRMILWGILLYVATNYLHLIVRRMM